MHQADAGRIVRVSGSQVRRCACRCADRVRASNRRFACNGASRSWAHGQKAATGEMAGHVGDQQRIGALAESIQLRDQPLHVLLVNACRRGQRRKLDRSAAATVADCAVVFAGAWVITFEQRRQRDQRQRIGAHDSRPAYRDRLRSAVPSMPAAINVSTEICGTSGRFSVLRTASARGQRLRTYSARNVDQVHAARPAGSRGCARSDRRRWRQARCEYRHRCPRSHRSPRSRPIEGTLSRSVKAIPQRA